MIRQGVAVALMILASSDAAAAVYPHAFAYRKVMKLNYGWKFNQGTPAGTASDKAYNDGSWQSVNLPHSCSYSDVFNDADYYKGDAWYRKRFTPPAGGMASIEFEGAMQSADVWLNGQSVGRHDNSGYTGFAFDVSDKLLPGQVNVLALKLNNVNDKLIPPGVPQPDWRLYSGLYRDVWLVVTDSLRIPWCGQQITTPQAGPASAIVRVKTTVRNDHQSGTNCTVTISIRDSLGVEVQRTSATQTVAAGASSIFDMTSDAIASPKLWSTDAPYLYQVYTTVSIDGTVVDDYYEEFGIRSLEWKSDGLYLNGAKFVIKGVNLHQFFVHVGNAVPRSRFYKEILLAKGAGFNAIRCSHYPRDPEFYRAADKLGVLLIVEVPSWGAQTETYDPAFWARLKKCVPEMIRVGYNHPSIMAWGVFNEPNYNIPASNIKDLADTARMEDSTRPTYMGTPYTQGQAISQLGMVDMQGFNYFNNGNWWEMTPAAAYAGWHPLMTEYAATSVERGAPEEAIIAGQIQDSWQYISTGVPAARLAGGFLWCLVDYFAIFPYNGIVDPTRIPKQSYYLYRKNWLGIDPDDAVAGTATQIRLDADMTRMTADGTDLTICTASLRDAAGKCINAAKSVTFTLTGPATMFGPVTKATIAGKVAAVLKSTTQAGAITLTASAAGLTSATTVISSEAVTDSLPAKPPAFRGRSSRAPAISYGAGRALWVNAPGDRSALVLVTDARGRILHQQKVGAGAASRIDIGTVPAGLCFVAVLSGTAGIAKAVAVVNQSTALH